MNKIRTVIIVGPTAVGKTEISIQVAKAISGEIISADSRYLYRGMDIGTAKPSDNEMGNIPHHLIDVAEISELWSIAQYTEAVLGCMQEINDRGKLPLIVGGTGQYIRALIEGWNIPELASDPSLREGLAQWAKTIGTESLHKKLALMDPAAAEKIDHRNVRRTIRALEVIFRTGRKFSTQRNKKPVSFIYKIVGLTRPRKDLYQRIDDRIEKMISSGFIQEVKKLIKQGYTLENPPMSAIGYREIFLFLSGNLSLEEGVLLMKRRTRLFVRRQANWFKENDTRIRWFDVTQNGKDEIIKFIKNKKGWLP